MDSITSLETDFNDFVTSFNEFAKTIDSDGVQTKLVSQKPSTSTPRKHERHLDNVYEFNVTPEKNLHTYIVEHDELLDDSILHPEPTTSFTLDESSVYSAADEEEESEQLDRVESFTVSHTTAKGRNFI